MNFIYDESCTRIIQMDQAYQKERVQHFLEETYNELSAIDLEPKVF